MRINKEKLVLSAAEVSVKICVIFVLLVCTQPKSVQYTLTELSNKAFSAENLAEFEAALAEAATPKDP